MEQFSNWREELALCYSRVGNSLPPNVHLSIRVV